MERGSAASHQPPRRAQRALTLTLSPPSPSTTTQPTRPMRSTSLALICQVTLPLHEHSFDNCAQLYRDALQFFFMLALIIRFMLRDACCDLVCAASMASAALGWRPVSFHPYCECHCSTRSRCSALRSFLPLSINPPRPQMQSRVRSVL